MNTKLFSMRLKGLQQKTFMSHIVLHWQYSIKHIKIILLYNLPFRWFCFLFLLIFVEKTLYSKLLLFRIQCDCISNSSNHLLFPIIYPSHYRLLQISKSGWLFFIWECVAFKSDSQSATYCCKLDLLPQFPLPRFKNSVSFHCALTVACTSLQMALGRFSAWFRSLLQCEGSLFHSCT